jgi:fatty-acyl-CoA synthase
MAWNYGDILDAVGTAVPADKPCLIHDDTIVSWGEFNRRSNNLARRFLNRGAQASDKVAFYMRNCPAYLEALGACFKARLTHVNVNYRYVDNELWYILDNSDSKIVVYGSEFAEHICAGRPARWMWLEVCDGTPEVEFAVSFDELAEIGNGSPLDIPRSGDDMIFLYTGGTTGMPKGVMWAHDDHWLAGAAGATPATNMVPPKNIAEHAANVKAAGGGGGCCPAACRCTAPGCYGDWRSRRRHGGHDGWPQLRRRRGVTTVQRHKVNPRHRRRCFRSCCGRSTTAVATSVQYPDHFQRRVWSPANAICCAATRR